MYIAGMLEQMVLQREALRYINLPTETTIEILIDNLRKTLNPREGLLEKDQQR